MKTVALSLTWGLEATRATKAKNKVLRTAQTFQTVKIMGLKRKVTDGIPEPWLEYHFRTLWAAEVAISGCNACVVKYLQNKNSAFASHISKFGMAGNPQHSVKLVVLWRGLAWWRCQKTSNSRVDVQSQFTHQRDTSFPPQYLEESKDKLSKP